MVSVASAGWEAAAESLGSVVGVGSCERSGFSSASELSVVLEAAGTVAGVALALLFCPAFAAASAPACRMAIVNGESTVLPDRAGLLSLVVASVLSLGSDMEM